MPPTILRKGRLLLTIVAAVITAACAVGPDYRPPVETLAHDFHGSAAMEQRTGAVAAPPLSTWWTGFNDPELNLVVSRALAQNLDLAQAVARVSQARAGTKAALSALLPSGQVTADAARAHQSLEDQLGRVESASPDFNRNGGLYDLGIGASWEIDLFGGLRRSREATEAEYQASDAARAATQLTVVAEAADTYVLVRTLQARIDLAQGQARTQQKLVDLVRLQYSRGVASEFQLRQAEGQSADVAAAIPGLETDLNSALNSLDVLMGSAPGTYRAELENPGAIPHAPAVQTADGPTSLLRRRPDIIAAERRLAASNARIGEAISGYYPKISLTGLIGSSTTVAGNLLSSDANLAQGIAGLRWRLFDFGQVDAEVKSAKGKNAEALAAYRLTVLEATAEVENAFSALVKHEAQIETLSAGEASLARAQDSASAGYHTGALSLVDVLDAQARLQRTQDERILAQSAAAHAAIASFRALGGGWGDDVSEVKIAARR